MNKYEIVWKMYEKGTKSQKIKKIKKVGRLCGGVPIILLKKKNEILLKKVKKVQRFFAQKRFAINSKQFDFNSQKLAQFCLANRMDLGDPVN